MPTRHLESGDGPGDEVVGCSRASGGDEAKYVESFLDPLISPSSFARRLVLCSQTTNNLAGHNFIFFFISNH